MFYSAQFAGFYFYIATAAVAPVAAAIKDEGAIFLRRIIFFYCVFIMPMDDRQSGHVCGHFSFN